MLYNITRSTETGESSITVFFEGEMLVTDSSNPNWEAIFETAMEGLDVDSEYYGEDADWFRGLFDMEAAATQKLAAAQAESLSERVTIKDGVVYVDHDPVDGSIAKQIGRFINEGVVDWKPLVAFLENIMANPNGHSRNQLYDWLMLHDFSISDDGCFYAYKGLNAAGRSVHAGPGIVNGEHVNGQLDNAVGNVIELPRSDVHHDPSVGCSTGLHAGTYSYASTFGNGVTVRVKINPRDVVSVPTDCDWQKIRCCRYTVVEVVHSESNPAVYRKTVDNVLEDDDWQHDDFS